MGGNVVAAGRDHVADPRRPDPRVDDAVRRVLPAEGRAGALRPPRRPTPPSRSPRRPRRPGRRRAEAAERCPVLLENDGTLPLPDGPLRVLLTGPYADSTDHLGAWVQSFAEPAGSSPRRCGPNAPTSRSPCCRGASFDGADPARQEEVARAAAGFDVVLVAVGEPVAPDR